MLTLKTQQPGCEEAGAHGKAVRRLSGADSLLWGPRQEPTPTATRLGEEDFEITLASAPQSSEYDCMRDLGQEPQN